MTAKVKSVALQASNTQTASNTSAAVTSLGQYRELLVFLSGTAASGTSPTLVVSIQSSDDNGATWYTLPNATFTQATGVTGQAIPIMVFGDTLRVTSTIGGTSPSFTYRVTAIGK